MSWHTGRFAPFDLETTSVDPEQARIVTAYVGRCGGGQPTEGLSWLVAVHDVEIPAEATAIHGISTEHCRATGMDQVNAIAEITAAVEAVLAAGLPLVGHNIGGYDLTVLDRECRRHLQAGLDQLIERPLAPVLDTFVLDRAVVGKRRRPSPEQGARALKTVCQAHGLDWDDAAAHEAEYDAMQSARVAYMLGRRFPAALSMPLAELHERQVKWAAEQAVGLQRYLRTKDPAAVVDGSWPLRPFSGSGS